MLSSKAAAFGVDALLGNVSSRELKRSKILENSESSAHLAKSKKLKCSENPQSVTSAKAADSPESSRSPISAEYSKSLTNTECLETSDYAECSQSLTVKECSESSTNAECSKSPIVAECLKSSSPECSQTTKIPECSKTQKPLKNSSSSKNFSEESILIDNINEETCSPRIRINEDILKKDSTPNLFLNNKSHIQNNLRERIFSFDPQFPTASSSIGQTWAEGINLTWHQPDYFHYHLMQRRDKSLTTSYFLGENNLLEKERTRPFLTSFGEKQTESESENQRILDQNGVTVLLEHHTLWAEFHQHQTEMIITKNGRRMFPVIKIRVYGLHPDSLYMIYLDMEAVDGKRYRYAYPSSTWVVAGTGDTSGQEQVYIHPDSPATGRHWMEMLIISFDKLKLTNNRHRETNGQIFLHSMQKYKPRVWTQCLGSAEDYTQTNKLPYGVNLHKLIERKHSLKFSFSETSFITVTAYQNQRITRLKINSNPFAKGFRDNSKYKETIERHLMTSASCGMSCHHSQHFPFNSPSSFPPNPYFTPPFAFSQIMPLPPSSHLRPAVPPNRWSSFIPSVKPVEDILPPLNSFLNPPLIHCEGNQDVIDLRLRRENT